MAFSGGGANKAFTPFTMTAGQPAQAPTSSAGAFSFGGVGSNPSAFGSVAGIGASGVAGATPLSFGGSATTPAGTSSSLFSFGSATTTPSVSTATPSFGFGNTGTSAPLMPSLGTVATQQPTAFGVATGQPTQGITSVGAITSQSSGVSSLGATASSLSSSGTNQPILRLVTPSLGGTSTATSQPLAGTAAPISFTSVPPTTSTVPATSGVSAAVNPGGSTLPKVTTSAATISFGTVTGTGASTGLSLGTGAPSLNLGGSTLATTTTAATSSSTTITPVTSAGGGASSSTATSTVNATSQPSGGTVSQMNFRQLQEAVNKWMMDLQEQEKLFMDQATKVNAWDLTLIANGDKIAKMNESITKVKNDHTRLEHALDYLKSQQQEFEAFLGPLEASLPVNAPVEPEREQLYSLTENVDTQLQQMAEDLKGVISHINESNKTVDKNDPVCQILHILNEHTDALQWVEDNASQVRRSLQDVSKQHQMAKREHERTLRQRFK